MYARIIRNVFRLSFSFAVVLCLIALNVLLLVSNYLACKISFELLGTEARPLGTDELVGVFFRTYFAESASLAHLYAFLVAVTVSVGIFLISKLAFETMKLLEDQRVYNENNDAQSAQIARRMTRRNLIIIASVALPLGVAIYWDMHLFRFRSIAQVMGCESPEKVFAMKAWSEQLTQNSGAWVWFLTKIGAWGYLAITAICCLSLEYALYRLGENWALLADAVGELSGSWTGPELQTEDDGYDQHIRPAHWPDNPVPQGPGRMPGTVHNHEGFGPRNGSQRPENVDPNNQTPTNVVIPGEVLRGRDGAGDRDSATQFPSGNPDNGPGHTSRPDNVLFEPPPEVHIPQEIRPQAPPGRRENEMALHPVIGGSNGEQVTLAEALAHPEMYWVDSDTHEIWNVNYRGTLMQ